MDWPTLTSESWLVYCSVSYTVGFAWPVLSCCLHSPREYRDENGKKQYARAGCGDGAFFWRNTVFVALSPISVPFYMAVESLVGLLGVLSLLGICTGWLYHWVSRYRNEQQYNAAYADWEADEQIDAMVTWLQTLRCRKPKTNAMRPPGRIFSIPSPFRPLPPKLSSVPATAAPTAKKKRRGRDLSHAFSNLPFRQIRRRRRKRKK